MPSAASLSQTHCRAVLLSAKSRVMTETGAARPVAVKGHSYIPAFMILEIMPLVSCLIFLWLGPYPFPEQGQAVAGAAEKTPA
jgi:hypothetical protein